MGFQVSRRPTPLNLGVWGGGSGVRELVLVLGLSWSFRNFQLLGGSDFESSTKAKLFQK